MVLLALLLDFLGRLLNRLYFSPLYIGAPFGCLRGRLWNVTQRNSQVFAPLQLPLNSPSSKSIVQVIPVLWYFFALFVCYRLPSFKRLHEWCCNTADWVSQTRYTALFELGAACKIGSLLPVPLSDYVGIVREALLLAFNRLGVNVRRGGERADG
jgi:hypothetical protein